MRRIIVRAAVIAALAAVLFTAPAFAEDGQVTGEDVNFRSGPGMNYTVIDCLPKGAVVTVNDRSDASWYSVTYNGQTGFISAAYLSVTETAPAPEQPVEPVQSTETVVTASSINAMYVRFRSGPSTDYSILGEYNKGTSVQILGSSGEWLNVSINGQIGYVYRDYVTTEESVSVPAAEPVPETPTEPEVTVDPVVPAVAETPVVETPAPQVPSFEITESPAQEGYINANYVRFRTGPSTSYSIISSYNRNQALTVTGASGEWSRVYINGQEGYVFTSYVTLKEPEPAPVEVTAPAEASGEKAYIKGTNVRFRSAPALNDNNILGEYSTGTEVSVLSSADGWTKAIISGQTGYIYSSYVTAIAPAVAVSGSTDGQKVANYALQFVGCDYVWGGNSPEEGFDCSGLVHYVFEQFGITTHRVACDIAGDGVHVDADQLQPGDVLCFYSTSDYIGHVGIYIGNDQFVHASTYTTGVIISDLETSYYANNFEARRIV